MSKPIFCPFCGSNDVTVIGSRLWYTECDACGARSGQYGSRGAAIEAWNTRYERTTTMTTDAGSQHWYSCDTCECDGYAAELPNYCPSCGARVLEE